MSSTQVSFLQQQIKLSKQYFDNPAVRRSFDMLHAAVTFPHYAPDRAWQGEGYHELARIIIEHDDNPKLARRLLLSSLKCFDESQYLARARVLRDLGLLECSEAKSNQGIAYIQTALELHRADLKHNTSPEDRVKGLRHMKITQNYLWRAQIMSGLHDSNTMNKSVNFALTDSRDCWDRDQIHAIAFALRYVRNDEQRLLLNARMVEMKAKRHKVTGVAFSMAHLAIGLQRVALARSFRFLFRREE